MRVERIDKDEFRVTVYTTVIDKAKIGFVLSHNELQQLYGHIRTVLKRRKPVAAKKKR